MSFWKWSRTAASNATADSTINWAEGQLPSTVNNSARAMMAAAAKYRDDMAGAAGTGGTSSAYTISSAQTFTSLSDGLTIGFIPHVTNAAGCTINVDGLGAKKIRALLNADLDAGVLIAGSVYVATFKVASGGFYDAWMLRNVYVTPGLIPVGACVPYFGSSAPSANFAFPYGQAISRTTYAALFATLGTTYGAGDGSTTFNLPDMRGRVPVPKDDMGGTAASRVTTAGGGLDGATLGAVGGAQSIALTTAQLPVHAHNAGTLATASDGAHTHDIADMGTASDVQTTGGGFRFNNTGGTKTTTSGGAHTHAISGSTGNEGSGSTHANVQPGIVTNYIIRVI